MREAMLEGTRILVVDDDVAIRRLARIVLMRRGATVDEARNGYEAITAMNERRYDSVLLDLMMPGCSGYDVINYLEDAGMKRRCVVVISAASDREIARVSSPLLHCILQKPFDVDDLARTVADCIVAQSRHATDTMTDELDRHSN